jgi:phage-related protein
MGSKEKERITDAVKLHIDDAMERYVVSKYNEWSGLISSIKQDTADMKEHIKDVRQDVKNIQDQVKPLLSEAEFWGQFWSKVRVGGNILTWTVGVIAAILILSGQAKAILLGWLASRTF